MIKFLKENAILHFEYEDQEIFPIVLMIGDVGIKKVVRDLQKEHITIISKFDLVRDIIARCGFSFNDKESEGEFVKAAKDMVKLMLEHARKEDETLFPYLENKGVDVKLDLEDKSY